MVKVVTRKLQEMAVYKKKAVFQNKLTESIGKPKDLWRALKSLVLLNKISSCEISALKVNDTVEINSEIEGFNYYSTLTEETCKNVPQNV